MNTNLHGESAKIYQFPVGGRLANGRRDAAKPAADMMLPRAAKIVFGGNWYHEEAVQEASQAVKR